jgi:hypothetical protein
VVSRDPDPTLVRHIYDLHVLQEHIDPAVLAGFAREIVAAETAEFGNQHPAYAADIEVQFGQFPCGFAVVVAMPAPQRALFAAN